jgi:hypothetical protein
MQQSYCHATRRKVNLLPFKDLTVKSCKQDKAGIKRAFVRTKRRLQAAFEASTDNAMDSGCREEHQVRWSVLLVLDHCEKRLTV